jgi:hypothetical protein
MITLDKVEVDNAVVAMCAAAQLPLSALEDPRYKDQVTAFVLALNKNHEREQTYDGLWREYGLTDCANNAKSKALRLAHHGTTIGHVDGPHGDAMRQLHEDAEDDALDLINYGAFCARLIHESATVGPEDARDEEHPDDHK